MKVLLLLHQEIKRFTHVRRFNVLLPKFLFSENTISDFFSAEKEGEKKPFFADQGLNTVPIMEQVASLTNTKVVGWIANKVQIERLII